ncbi:MAG: fused MFS/spermidine synthase [Alphaproteobacteria bacterium]|nr:fused MFS/spermidine synthase [Alphaproteobacteria bacterium]
MLALLYAVVIFGNAFLLFLVQPLIGKAILPWFGGSASVWTICMLFFQAVLLGGYALAHVIAQHLAPRGQGLVQLGLIAASLLTLPIVPAAALKPVGDSEPILAILTLLAVSVGLPYLVLATTSPLLQRWFAADLPGRSPYRLFALSNLASMLALVGYPFLVEPAFALRVQQVGWSWAYAAIALPFAGLALRRALRGGAAVRRAGSAPDATAPAQVLLWVALAATPSILLLAVTSQLTQNVAPVPLLWLAPLTLYLASFILCFESERWYRRGLFLALFPVALLGLAFLPLVDLDDWPMAAVVPSYLVAAFVVFMVCHGELARRRPPPAILTRYYLWISFGGALGGIAVGIVAPRVFDADHDLAVAVFLAALAVVGAQAPDWRALAPAGRGRRLMLQSGALLAAFAVMLVVLRDAQTENALLSVRNFYGTLHIEEEGEAGDPDEKRQLFHGRIMHGEQYLAAARRRQVTSYYTASSGIGIALEATRRAGEPQRIGVIGLGAGVLAAAGRAGDVVRYYEINPLVVQLANSQFTFLKDAAAKVELALGDARLVLEREAPQRFDVLAVDAFTGDAIPVHLLTEEAIALYLRHLREDGLLVVHVSNKYLDLAPLVRLAAGKLGWEAQLVDDEGDDDDDEGEGGTSGSSGSSWVIVAKDPGRFAVGRLGDEAEAIEVPAGLKPWRDDYSSLFAVLRRPGADE